VTLRSLRIDHESKISFQEERLTHLKSEMEVKLATIQEQDSKILSLTDTIEKKEYTIKDMD